MMAMATLINLLILGVIFFIIVVALMRVARGGSNKQVELQHVQIDWQAVSDVEIWSEIEAGRKINAIKRYRELTGVGLKEAKRAIEIMIDKPTLKRTGKSHQAPEPGPGVVDLVQAGQVDEAVEVYRKFAGVDVFTAQEVIEGIQADLAGQKLGVDDSHIDDLLANDRIIEAVKYYREQTGVGLKEAKDAIDQRRGR